MVPLYFCILNEGVIFMRYTGNETIMGTLPNGMRIKYKITEVDNDCVYAVDIDTGERYAWSRRTYEKKNNINFDNYLEE